MLVKKALIKLITVRTEPVEGLNQSFLKGLLNNRQFEHSKKSTPSDKLPHQNYPAEMV